MKTEFYYYYNKTGIKLYTPNKTIGKIRASLHDSKLFKDV